MSHMHACVQKEPILSCCKRRFTGMHSCKINLPSITCSVACRHISLTIGYSSPHSLQRTNLATNFNHNIFPPNLIQLII
uniref:TIDP3438 n=1 Tax=Arundo donax TaxID=35708 RepID=A0A0A9FJW7_ARUDO